MNRRFSTIELHNSNFLSNLDACISSSRLKIKEWENVEVNFRKFAKMWRYVHYLFKKNYRYSDLSSYDWRT